jgi:hypothetical protein
MEHKNQQSENPTLPTTGVSTITQTIVSTLEDSIKPSTLLAHAKSEAAKNRLRAKWHFGDNWRLEFGRELRISRNDIPHGEWIDFLETEFGLHRQTAYNWMRKAAEADGVSLDEPQTNSDEPDTHAETVTSLIDEAREKVENAPVLNGPKQYRLILDAVTEDEKELFKAEMKSDRDWAQSILRTAFETVIAGKPVVHADRVAMEMLPEDNVLLPIEVTDNDLTESFFGEAATEVESADVRA